jgi:pimeloyl-ACP methyl ester carboxylesterase
MSPTKRAILISLIAMLIPATCMAAHFQISIPLQDGRLGIGELRQTLEHEWDLPASVVSGLPDVNISVDLRGIDGWMMVRALNSAMGDGFHFAVKSDELIATIDSRKLPASWNDACDALARFTTVAAPEAVARQNRRLGLHLPQLVDEKRPMVVLIHGLDGDGCSCDDLSRLIDASGYQTATFVYPAERPLAESGRLLAKYMSALRDQFPNLRIDLVTESMGGLVARQYVEGPDYAGGVDHFILIAPPNEGSNWVGGAWLLKLIVNAAQWKNDAQWSPAWMITEGINQEVNDLRPQSDFLTRLNSLHRRTDVRYTIIAGDRPAAYRYEANLLGVASELLDTQFSSTWGVSQIYHATVVERNDLLNRTGRSDGPVELDSAGLTGVKDFVVLPVDHIALFKSVDGNAPAAWPVIRDRLLN